MDAESPRLSADIAKFLSLLPLLESGQPLYRIHADSSIDPYDYGPELRCWWAALGQSQFPLRFDWPQWLGEFTALERNPERLAQADLLTLRKLVTFYLRTERFTSGTLAHIIENGQLLKIMRRLAALNDEELRNGDLRNGDA